jgi:hypothetical protein
MARLAADHDMENGQSLIVKVVERHSTDADFAIDDARFPIRASSAGEDDDDDHRHPPPRRRPTADDRRGRTTINATAFAGPGARAFREASGGIRMSTTAPAGAASALPSTDATADDDDDGGVLLGAAQGGWVGGGW